MLRFFNSFYFVIDGVAVGVILYFQDYLQPILNTLTIRSSRRHSKWSTRRCCKLLTLSGAVMLVMFGSVFGGYIISLVVQEPPSNSVFTNCIIGRGPRHDFGGSSNVTVSGSDRINGSSEASRLTEWANAVKPSDYEALVPLW